MLKNVMAFTNDKNIPNKNPSHNTIFPVKGYHGKKNDKKF